MKRHFLYKKGCCRQKNCYFCLMLTQDKKFYHLTLGTAVCRQMLAPFDITFSQIVESQSNGILFTVGNVDRDISRYSGRYSGRHSVDTRSILSRQSVDTRSTLGRHSGRQSVDSRSTLGRDTVDSRSRCVSADIAFRSPTLRRQLVDSWLILDRCIGQ